MTLRRLAAVLTFLVAAAPTPAPAASYTTQNFVVTADNERDARDFGDQAEHFRQEKARLWLGQDMPPWPRRCPLKVSVTGNAAGGATTFTFGTAAGRPVVTSQHMEIHGPVRQLLHSVLPHEVTHTVLAYHFGRPVPRWADEGGSVLSENEEECFQHDIRNREILNQGRGIRLKVLFTLKEYPRDMIVVYAQGYSICNYLISRGGRPKFLEFVGMGMRSDNRNWEAAVREVYGYGSVDELEEAWIDSLRSPPTRVSARNRNDVAKAEPVGRSRSEVRSSGLPALPLLEPPVVARGVAPDREPGRPVAKAGQAPVAKVVDRPNPPPLPLLLPPEPPKP